MPSTLEVNRPRDGVAVVRLNRPKQLNAINETMQIELGQALADLGADRTAHALVLTGAGRGFCAGIDMRDFGPNVPEASAPAIDRLNFQEKMAGLAEAIRQLPQPVIAAVNGPAIAGGMGLAMLADFTLAVPEAKFGFTEVKLGYVPAIVASFLLRQVGEKVTRDLLLSGRLIKAQEAYHLGVVTQIVNSEELMQDRKSVV